MYQTASNLGPSFILYFVCFSFVLLCFLFVYFVVVVVVWVVLVFCLFLWFCFCFLFCLFGFLLISLILFLFSFLFVCLFVWFVFVCFLMLFCFDLISKEQWYEEAKQKQQQQQNPLLWSYCLHKTLSAMKTILLINRLLWAWFALFTFGINNDKLLSMSVPLQQTPLSHIKVYINIHLIILSTMTISTRDTLVNLIDSILGYAYLLWMWQQKCMLNTSMQTPSKHLRKLMWVRHAKK